MNYISEDEHVLKKEHFISNRHIIDSKPKTNLFKKIDEGKALPELIEDIEKKIIIQGLTKNNNNISHTARELGIKRQTLQHKLKKYDIS